MTQKRPIRLIMEFEHQAIIYFIRFNRNSAKDIGEARKRVIPTPVEAIYDDSKSVDISSGDWLVAYSSNEVRKEAEYLAGKL